MKPVVRIVLAGIGGYGIHYVHSLLQREKKGIRSGWSHWPTPMRNAVRHTRWWPAGRSMLN